MGGFKKMKSEQENCPHRFNVKYEKSTQIYQFCKIIEDKNKDVEPSNQTASECYPKVKYCRCPLGY